MPSKALSAAFLCSLIITTSAGSLGNRRLLSNRGSNTQAIALLGNGSYGLTIDGQNWLFSQYNLPDDGSMIPGPDGGAGVNPGFSSAVLDVGGEFYRSWFYAKTAPIITTCPPAITGISPGGATDYLSYMNAYVAVTGNNVCVYGQESVSGLSPLNFPLTPTPVATTVTMGPYNTTNVFGKNASTMTVNTYQYQGFPAALGTAGTTPPAYWGWQVFTASFPGMTSVACSSPTVCVAVGAASYDDGDLASAWKISGGTNTLQAFTGKPLSTLLQTFDGGFSWKRHDFGLSASVNGDCAEKFPVNGCPTADLDKIHFAKGNPQFGWAVGGDNLGNEGVILYTNDGGYTWMEQLPAPLTLLQLYQDPTATPTITKAQNNALWNANQVNNASLYVPFWQCDGRSKDNAQWGGNWTLANLFYIPSPQMCYDIGLLQNEYYYPYMPHLLSVHGTDNGNFAYAVSAVGNWEALVRAGGGTSSPIIANASQILPVIMKYASYTNQWTPLLNYSVFYAPSVTTGTPPPPKRVTATSFPGLLDISVDLLDVSVVNEDNVWAVGANWIMRTYDGGLTWALLYPLGYQSPLSFAPFSAPPLSTLAVSLQELRNTTLSNQTYAALYKIPAANYSTYTPPAWNFINMNNNAQGFIGGSNGTFNWFLRTSDGGRTWTCVSDNALGTGANFAGLSNPNANAGSGLGTPSCPTTPYNVYGMAFDSKKRFWFYTIDASIWGVRNNTGGKWYGNGQYSANVTATIGLVMNSPAAGVVVNTTDTPTSLAPPVLSAGVQPTNGFTLRDGNTTTLPGAGSNGTFTLPSIRIWQQEVQDQWFRIMNPVSPAAAAPPSAATQQVVSYMNQNYQLYGIISVASLPSINFLNGGRRRS